MQQLYVYKHETHAMINAIHMAKYDKPVFVGRCDDMKEDVTHNHFRTIAHISCSTRSMREKEAARVCVHLNYTSVRNADK